MNRTESQKRRFRPSGALMAFCALLGFFAATGAARSDDGPEPFPAWLDNLRAEALTKGISQQTVEIALGDVELIPRVIELDRKQPEFTQTLADYLEKRVTDDIVAQGKALLAENRELLAKVHAKYGVQPRFLVALWGIETKFGKYTGSFGVIPALVTLAYDDRRKDKFRAELFDALRIVDAGDVEAGQMTGSWAGAMGQNQFMPSVFLKFAVDFDGNGKRDIWNSLPDMFASAANYLSESGWKGDQTWGREVRLPPNFDHALADPFDHHHSNGDMRKSLSEWRTLGVRRADGGPLPTRDLSASLIEPDGEGGKAYLVYDNFRVLLTWNPAFLFAVTVGTLADRIGDD